MSGPQRDSADGLSVCGLVGVACDTARLPSIGADILARMRDRLAHRGPDAAGLVMRGNVGLAHRRLSVLDPTPTGAQPAESPDGRHAVVYNGELYNDLELRERLARAGARFESGCDTHTLVQALAHWGTAAIDQLRGMFAFAWHDRATHRLVLARDSLGIKPLYFWLGPTPGGLELVFASEPTALFAHPHIPVRPDTIGISAYLSTIRTSLHGRTMFEGVRSLLPGEWVEFDLTTPELARKTHSAGLPEVDEHTPLGEVIEESVRRHMRADVQLCSLLSGGLDSSIIVSIAREHDRGLHTYCAGTPCDDALDDLRSAQLVAEEFGLAHTSVEVSKQTFLQRWPEMVQALGVPLSTPNEVAISELARRIRLDGRIVALSGEGADELFAGYDRPLAAVRQAAASRGTCDAADLTAMEMEQNTWVSPSVKPAVLNEGLWAQADRDAWLIDATRAVFEEAVQQCAGRAGDVGDHALLSMLSYQRHVNLAGLLGRLDTATMLASVEGRTPFADIVVAAHARRIAPMHLVDWQAQPIRTKRALRDAFGSRIPALALGRAKASFPLPFIGWLQEASEWLRNSEWVREVFTPAAIEAVAQQPAQLWRLAWPMMNLAIWGEHWWGAQKERGPERVPGLVQVAVRGAISDDAAWLPDHQAPAAPASSESE